MEVKKEVEQYMRSKGIVQNFLFSASSNCILMAGIKYPVAIEPAPKVINYELIQPYIYHYANSYRGNPKRVGYAIYRSVNASRNIGIKNMPSLSPGLCYTNPSCQLDPRAQMKYQILEGALAGMDGYEVYAGNDIDLGDLRQMALANRLITKYEDIIMDGQPVEDIFFVDSTPETKTFPSLRARRLGDRTLLWVADYTTYKPVSTVMKIRVTVDKLMVVIDAESGAKVGTITPGKNVIDVEVKEERGRLLLIQP